MLSHSLKGKRELKRRKTMKMRSLPIKKLKIKRSLSNSRSSSASKKRRKEKFNVFVSFKRKLLIDRLKLML